MLFVSPSGVFDLPGEFVISCGLLSGANEISKK